jgi:cation diffusion facilitator CzcD-associated flavoprotein CzcO
MSNSGLIAYREFTEAGFQRVRLFERDDVPGGNWHYTDETPLDAPIPNAEPAVADYTPSLPPNLTNLPIEEHYRSDWEARWREHRGPRPVWESLESNSPAVCRLRSFYPQLMYAHWVQPEQQVSATSKNAFYIR